MTHWQNSQLIVLTYSMSVFPRARKIKIVVSQLFFWSNISWIWDFRFKESISPFCNNPSEPKLKAKGLKHNHYQIWAKEGHDLHSPGRKGRQSSAGTCFHLTNLYTCSLRYTTALLDTAYLAGVSYNSGVLEARQKYETHLC